MVKLLLAKGALDSINEKAIDGWTPLYSACRYGDVEMVRLLLGKGADQSINEKNQKGYTPLHTACEKGALEMVRLLLDNGADQSINEKNNKGKTPLDLSWNNNMHVYCYLRYQMYLKPNRELVGG